MARVRGSAIRWLALGVAALALGVSLSADTRSVPAPSLPPALTKALDPVIDALFARFDLKAAQDHVKFVTQYWRLPGNTGYDATIDRVHARLVASGFHERGDGRE
jgi:hypothetical protein